MATFKMATSKMATSKMATSKMATSNMATSKMATSKMATSKMAVSKTAFLCCLANKHDVVPVVTFDQPQYWKATEKSLKRIMTDDFPEVDVRKVSIMLIKSLMTINCDHIRDPQSNERKGRHMILLSRCKTSQPLKYQSTVKVATQLIHGDSTCLADASTCCF